MYKMIPSNGHQVTITGNHPDTQVGIGHLDSGSNGCCPSVHTVKSVGIDIIGEPGRTTDPGNKYNIFLFIADFRQCSLYGGKYRMPTASGAPFNGLIYLKICFGQYFGILITSLMIIPPVFH